MMKLKKSAQSALILSLAVVLVGLAAWAAGIGMRFRASDGAGIDFVQMALCMLAAVIFSLVFGMVRYSVPVGIALMVATAHDYLAALAVTALVAMLLPQPATLPLAAMMTIAFTYCQTLPVLRMARKTMRSTPIRDRDYDLAATNAVAQQMNPMLMAVAAALVILLAAAVSGNLRLIAGLVPLLAGLGASLYSSRRITPYIWAAVAPWQRTGKSRR